MKARITGMSIGIDGMQRITISTDEDFRDQYDDLNGVDIEVTMKRFRQKRSLDANAYAWVLIDKIANALSLTKDEVYREAIRDIGGVSDTVCVKNEAVENLLDGWRHNGMGWFGETFPSKLQGCTNVVLYYGSSTYDSKQMHSLIDVLIQACIANNIEHMTPDQIAELFSAEGEQHG